MVYESDFYTTRRPYRSIPSYSTYTTSYVPSRQVRILPGLGKVHIVHTYNRIVPYIGHKRLTVVTSPPKVYSTRPSILQKEYDWIESKVRPWVSYSATNRYLNSDSSVRIVYVRNPLSGLYYDLDYYPTRYYSYYRMIRPLSLSYDDYWTYYRPLSSYDLYWPFYRALRKLDDIPLYRSLRLQRIFDDETRLIRAQTASLLKQIHLPVPRIRSWPITPLNRYGDFPGLPAKYSNDTYIHKLLTLSPTSKVEYATYYTEPVKKYIGHGHLSCVSYAGDKGYNRRQPLAFFEDTLKNDIQLLSYYINKFRQEKAQPKEIKAAPLPPARPSRIFSVHKPLEDPVNQEIKDLRDARAARLAKIYESEKSAADVESTLKAKQRKEEQRLAEERAIAEEQAKKEAARKAELERQEKLAAQAAAERAAELERQAELARQEELAKQAEIERLRQLEEERAREEEQRRLEEEAKAEEERQQLLRLEEIARQAEEEREAELARQAEELAELARQEAERAELERQERERQEQEQKEAELAELARQEAELAELERQEQELAALAKQEAALAEKLEAEAAAAAEEPAVDEPVAAEQLANDVQEEPVAEDAEKDVLPESVDAVEPAEPVVDADAASEQPEEVTAEQPQEVTSEEPQEVTAEEPQEVTSEEPQELQTDVDIFAGRED